MVVGSALQGREDGHVDSLLNSFDCSFLCLMHRCGGGVGGRHLQFYDGVADKAWDKAIGFLTGQD